jgi:ankyrin repeat protein
VKLLLEHEASPNLTDDKGCSPLHLAAWTGNVHIVKLLICHGPSVTLINLLVSYQLFKLLFNTLTAGGISG